MIPPTSRDLIQMGNSKYAVVVAVAKRARELSEFKKREESYRLSTMVTYALDEVTSGKLLLDTPPANKAKEE